MDVTVLLVLVCCWKLTEESDKIGSDVTGETLTTAMDFLILTTSDQSTSQDGKTDMTTVKDTNTSRGVIERQRQDLDLLTKTIEDSEKDAGNTICGFIGRMEENIGHLALNKTTQYLQDLEGCVNRSKKLNISIDEHNSSADNEIKINEISGIEEILNRGFITKYQVDYLSTLMHTNVKLKALIDSLLKNREKYGETYDVSMLEDNVAALNGTIQLLNEHIHVAKELVHFRESFNLTPCFSNPYNESLVDLKMWESELQTQNHSLVEYNEELKENIFRLLSQNDINLVIQSVIFIIGCLGNGALLAVFSMHRDMRTPPYLMLLNLAVGDFLSLISNILIYNILQVSGGVWHYGLALCRFYRFVRHLCLGVTVYSVVVISVQRFFALRVFFNWQGFGSRATKKYMYLLLIACVWLLASAIALPRTVNAGVYSNRCLGYCAENSKGYYRMVNTIDFVALCVFPLAIIAVLTGTTARRIIVSITDMSGETEGKQKVKQARLLSSNILISLAVVFAVCYVPYFLYAFLNAWFEFDVDNSTQDLIYLFTFSLIFANSCINPIAVYLASRRYRSHMNRYLLCKYRQQVVREKWKTSAETSITPEAQL